MPNPSAVKASDVNIEMGVGSTTTLKWGNNWVRNVATQYTGTNSDVNASKFRWGINFPGGNISPFGALLAYDTTSNVNLNADELDFAPGTVSASVTIRIESGGTLLYTATSGAASYSNTGTWLTSGSASDYTAQLQINSGDNPGGSTLNTDLNLGTTVEWVLSVSRSTVGLSLKTCNGNLIVKDGSGTLITRPFTMQVTAELQA